MNVSPMCEETNKFRVDIKGGSTKSLARDRMSQHKSQYWTGAQNYGYALGKDSVIYEKEFKNYYAREQRVINTIRFLADSMEQTGLFSFKLHHAPLGDKRGVEDESVKGIDSKLYKFLCNKLAEMCVGDQLALVKRAKWLNAELKSAESKIKAYKKENKKIINSIGRAKRAA